MRKKLSEMTLEELWALFPILLTEHQPQWILWYQEEEMRLKQVLDPRTLVRISHIGSTAIASIWAKPIVDILVEVSAEASLTDTLTSIEQCGFRCMSRSSQRISFNKGYTEQGFAEKVYHLHLRYAGDHDELYFRDYLMEHPEAAQEYEKLKLQLWKKYEHDRDEYTRLKADMVKKYTALARLDYGERYE